MVVKGKVNQNCQLTVKDEMKIAFHATCQMNAWAGELDNFATTRSLPQQIAKIALFLYSFHFSFFLRCCLASVIDRDVQLTVDPPRLAVFQGSEATFRCRAPSPGSVLTLRWSRADRRVSTRDVGTLFFISLFHLLHTCSSFFYKLNGNTFVLN